MGIRKKASARKASRAKVATKKATTKKASKKPATSRAPAKKTATKPPASTKPVWQKLLVKGGTVLLLNAPAGFEKQFAGSPANEVTRRAGAADTILVFAASPAQLDAALPAAVASLGSSSTLWIAYRKGNKTFHRDSINRQVLAHGLTGVAMIAIDDELSALRVKRI